MYQIACTKFISALNDPVLKQALRLAAPANLHQAIIKGLEIEAQNKEKSSFPNRIRQVETVENVKNLETMRPVLEAKRSFQIGNNRNAVANNTFSNNNSKSQTKRILTGSVSIVRKWAMCLRIDLHYNDIFKRKIPIIREIITDIKTRINRGGKTIGKEMKVKIRIEYNQDKKSKIPQIDPT